MNPPSDDPEHPPSNDPKLPLVIGIAGHRHLPGDDDLEKIEATVQNVFRAFSSERSTGEDVIGEMRKSLGFPRETIETGLPLETPVWILSSMAQGADILCSVMADKIYSAERGDRSIRFMAPLATPWKYRQEYEKKVISKYHAGCDDFIRIRGAGVGDRGETPPKNQDYEEFVLPLGGRGKLQFKTTFPADEKYLTLEKMEVEEIRKEIELLSDELGSEPDKINSHYRASAHYVALYSHVLIALWDGDLRGETSVGTDAAVRAKISGPAPGQISEVGLFNWADSGPVLQVFAANENTAAAKATGEGLANSLRKNADSSPSPGSWTVIHPNDCEPEDEKGKTRAEHGTDLFGHGFNSMNRLNRERVQDKPDSWFEPQVNDEAAPITASEVEFSKLHSIWKKAARLSEYSAKLKTGAENSFAFLFLLVAIAALLFDVYAHWYAGIVHGGPRHHPWLLLAFAIAVIAAVVLFVSLLFVPKIEARYLEYRAMAEATRIQLSWMIAGIPQSVPLHYLQRHRGAFDYIRDAVSTWCFPYENAQRWFDSLPDNDTKLSRLRYVVDNWVRDQEDYLRKNTRFQEHMHHLLHTLGTATALVGFSAATFLVGTGWSLPVEDSAGERAAEIALIAGIAGGITALVLFLRSSHHPDGKVAKAITVLKWPGLAIALLAPPLVGWFLPNDYGFAPDHPRESWPSGIILFISALFWLAVFGFVVLRLYPDTKKSSKILPYFPFALCAVTFCLLVWTTIHNPVHRDSATCGEVTLAEVSHAGGQPAGSSEPHDGHASSAAGGGEEKTTRQFPYILVIGIPLLLGALLVAWGEKMLHSETANQYRSAHDLFRLTEKRLERILSSAKEVLGDDDDFDEQVRLAQTSLYQLGKEALSENAEWLILHRTRPLEFPMAG